VSFLLAAHALREYASAQETKSADGASAWTAAQIRDTTRLANEIIADASWRRRVTSAIAANGGDLTQAADAAARLKIDTFELHMRALARNPENAQRWTLAFVTADATRVARLVALAEKEFSPSGAHPPEILEAILQSIASYPGSGQKLVESSLADPESRLRRAAVETLVRWGSAYLRDVSVRTALNDAARGEADEALKARMVALLNLGNLP
jgi:hypothetical protein